VSTTDRIETTHTGSLPRSEGLTEMMYEVSDGAPFSPALEGAVRAEVAAIVARQDEAGIAVVSDGEVGKPGFVTYARSRLTGLGGEAVPIRVLEAEESPDVLALVGQQFGTEAGSHIHHPVCDGDIRYVGHEAVRRDVENLASATAGRDPGRVFMTAASPGCLAWHITNEHYPDYESMLVALADAMREEYEIIADAGFVLQLDCPDIPSSHPAHTISPVTPVIERLGGHEAFVELQIEALNRATAGIAPEQLRMHLCWANYEGPHHHDVPLENVIGPVLRRARPRAVLFEAANARHEHEWQVFERLRVPDDKQLVPGVIATGSNYVEHPELVAQRLARYEPLVGPGQLQAGTDCGFGTYVGFGRVVPYVAWLKLRSLSEGAALASQRLWT
jgi:5-methyltetrahydropteroyltriglutamate--homocysteine methyltransferase